MTTKDEDDEFWDAVSDADVRNDEFVALVCSKNKFIKKPGGIIEVVTACQNLGIKFGTPEFSVSGYLGDVPGKAAKLYCNDCGVVCTVSIPDEVLDAYDAHEAKEKVKKEAEKDELDEFLDVVGTEFDEEDY